MQRGELWLIATILLVTLAVIVLPLTAVPVIAKIDEFFFANINEELSRCVNLNSCNLSDFVAFINLTSTKRGYRLNLIYFYCNSTSLEIGNFYNLNISLKITSELTQVEEEIENGKVKYFDVYQLGKHLNVSYLGKKIYLTCERRNIVKDLCLTFVDVVKCSLE
ncbi:MAG: hypothetical protein QW507_02230 [Candidatus Nanoarchaeia archaeon]|nr:hypothetical protein [Candidatus Haiyanarchaeum thermophilum]MCW1303237.1 hypothetical protein [Candidatus Haiyanarchaeum thermophilum]MCW1304031.1 hypothetical protein [Candidatus Haiyanarchaeum thermophilum]MCW1306396.1 hypothetical protein [Candidatus Haiyanarchaeum thermophilum]MCW1307305.1 hypothetical protein [Candidatus Haiyanarchaeum thermophilum]